MQAMSHLNQVQLSRRWSLSPRTLEAWRWRGEGPPYLKIRGRILYRLEDIERFEAENLVAQPAARSGVIGERRAV